MSLSIYKFSAQYITRTSLLGWQVEWTSNLLVWVQIPSKAKGEGIFHTGTVARLTSVDHAIYREISPISRDLSCHNTILTSKIT